MVPGQEQAELFAQPLDLCLIFGLLFLRRLLPVLFFLFPPGKPAAWRKTRAFRAVTSSGILATLCSFANGVAYTKEP